MREPLIMGIDTSCDDTSVAILRGRDDVLVNLVSSQVEFHRPFGGVVPEIASRKHIEVIIQLIDKALEDASVRLEELDAIAVTYGPGLIGSLLVGLTVAKGIAYMRDIPLIGINHLEGHIFSVFLSFPELKFPFLSLIVSGGHTELVLVKDVGEYELLGSTRDDAVGEAYDKVAKLLGLGYPGGPIIDRIAKGGDPFAINLPIPAFKGRTLDFSFSGIKSAVYYYTKGKEYRVEDVVASFQKTVIDFLVMRVKEAMEETGIRKLAVVGGVSANTALRRRIREERIEGYFPAFAYCTDNGAMIAEAGYYRFVKGEISEFNIEVNPSLKLIE
ncbi:MAG: tRNA (adenosine(37)-N6)-threonylcarbamoyltransferase complex transferase subunit TsaD [Synergistetes bacterium]|nr:tRNA (adenosine(37)-N6)-threonylcarbamoyltransferase complex transferase subunit TsaD [Synergistota bacterium]